MIKSEKISKAYLLFISFLVFLLSFLVTPYVIGGDQFLYIRNFNSINASSFFDGYSNYRKITGASEPLYYLFAWLFSNLGLGKVFFVSFFNGVLAYSFLLASKRLGFSIALATVMVLTNYYFLALYSELERLKIAFAFFFFALAFFHTKSFSKKGVVFLIASVLFHFQMSVLIVCHLFSKFFESSFLSFFISKRNVPLYLFLFSIFSLIFFFYFSAVVAKISFYIERGESLDYVSAIKILPFVMLSFLYSRSKWKPLALYIPLLLFILILGGGRLNLFAFFIFLYFSCQVRKGFNIGTLVSISYFSFQGLFEMSNIFEYGRWYQ